MITPIKIPKALNGYELNKKNFKVFDFTDKWFDAFALPERKGVWFIWGQSGNGKSSFALQLANYMTSFERVLINELEEGGLSTKMAWQRSGLISNKKVLMVQDKLDVLKMRLKKRQSPRIVLINSFQYQFKNYVEYQELKAMFPQKLFIITSQADGKKPVGRPAVSAQFDADLKIWVEGYKAFSKGRYIGANGGDFVIWEKGAYDYYGLTKNKNNDENND